MANTVSDTPQDYGKGYSQESLWDKIKNSAVSAGKVVLEPALVLYYCALDPDTPAWAKSVIVGALGYFIIPLDAIPDLSPGIGYTDDLGALASAVAIVAAHIKDEHKEKAGEQLKRWFSNKGNDNE